MLLVIDSANAVRTPWASSASPTAAQLFFAVHEIDVNSLKGAFASGDDAKSAMKGVSPTMPTNAWVEVLLRCTDPTTKQFPPGEHDSDLASTPTVALAPKICFAADQTPLVEVIVNDASGDDGVSKVPRAAQSPGAEHDTASPDALVIGPVIAGS